MTQIKNNFVEFNNILILIKLSFALKHSIVYKRVYAILRNCSSPLKLSDCQLSTTEGWCAHRNSLLRDLYSSTNTASTAGRWPRNVCTRCVNMRAMTLRDLSWSSCSISHRPIFHRKYFWDSHILENVVAQQKFTFIVVFFK